MTSVTQGEYITSCLEYLSRCATEVESLAECVQDRVRKRLENEGRSFPFAMAGGWETADKWEANRWFQTDASWSLPLKRKGKGKQPVRSYLSIQVSLVGDGLVPGTSEPVLHVSCLEDATVFEGDYFYMGFPLEAEEFDDDKLSVVGQRCLEWHRDLVAPWLSRWCYSVKLTALTGVADVDRLLVDPSMKLLAGIPVLEALPEEYLDREIFRYPIKDRLFELGD